jgi:putative DNA primase/helicase
MTVKEKKEMLQAALELACNHGWAVVPLHAVRDGKCTCRLEGKCDSKGKHPRLKEWGDKASTSEQAIVDWWQKWPEANIGIATGAISGLVVLDVDPKNGGDDSLYELEQKHGPLPDTVQVITGGGGRHFYFRHPGNGVVVKGTAGLGGYSGLDIRGDGGQVVAPPSLHESGRRYEWELSAHPESTPIADTPEWLEKLVTDRTPERKRAAPVGETIKDGERNATLISLAGSMRYRGFSEDAIYKALQIENQGKCKPPLPDREVERIATSAGKYTPKRVKGKAGLLGTELENAERLVSLHGADLLYCHPRGSWLVWDGRRWKRDATAEARRRAVDTVRHIYGEAEAADNEKERKALSKWARQSESNRQINAMMNLAAADARVVVLPEQLDSDPWALNCLNGTVDLRTGELREHRRADLITKLAPVEYEPMLGEMEGEPWDSFLEQMIPDPEERAFLQRAVGYTLTGNTGEEVLFLIHGPAAAGKSTFAEAVKGALGDYSATADFETFLRRRYIGGPRNDIARLIGARYVASIEVEEGGRLAEGLVKMLTGGDTVTARFLRQEHFEFKPLFKLWLVANRKPEIKDGGDSALWRRILLVPFTVSIPEPERDPTVKARLRDPDIGGRAVLPWAVKGCLAWQKKGLNPPPTVKVATQAYRQEMDPLEEFIEDCCLVEPAAEVTVKALYEAYNKWCERNGEKHPLSKRAVGLKLADRGEIKGDRDSTPTRNRLWRGIGLRTDL